MTSEAIPHSRTRRIITKVIVFLLLGAIVNVAVAWGFAAFWRLESSIGLTDHSVFQAGQFAHFECQSGLPFRSLRGQVSCVRGGQEEADGLFAIGLWTGATYLPYDVLWPGFAINTIFYAAILWLLFITPGRLRRLIRIKVHRCPTCGYKIAERVGPVCSECGHPLKPQRGDGV